MNDNVTRISEFDDLLRLMNDKDASDLFITVGVPPSIKRHGEIIPLTKSNLSPEQARRLVFGVMNERQRDTFTSEHECNFALSRTGIGRFRVSAFQQRNQVGMVLRRIVTTIPTVEELGLPDVCKEFSLAKRGLVIIVGGTGTGKSSTLAAMVGHRNHNSNGHIVTIEDPIEFIHQHEKSIVTQRELGIDTNSYEVALANTLRQAPDVIVISEVRTREVLEYALAFAETGHLCLMTLHANTADQAIERIIHFFPDERRKQILLDLSLNLRAVVAQQLIPSKGGDGRELATEVLVNTPLVADMLRQNKLHELKGIMGRTNQEGMCTFDQALYHLYSQERISMEEAIIHADSPNELKLMMKLNNGEISPEMRTGLDKLSLEDL